MTGHYFQPKVRDAIIIKTDNKNRGTLPLAVMTGVYPGKDGIVRAVELKTAQGTLQRPTQHLYPLELTCDNARETAQQAFFLYYQTLRRHFSDQDGMQQWP